MPLETEKRNYKLTDAELCMFTSNLCNLLTHDLSSLSVFGVTAPKIAALKALGDAFEVFPTDEVLIADYMAATEEKNTILEELKETIRNMALRCQLKWGDNSWQETSLGITGMNDFTDEVMLVAANRVHSKMTAFLADLADFGLTQDLLDDFADLIESYELALNNQNDKNLDRVRKSNERITKGNELYAQVVFYCDIGKRVFAKTNPTAYNNYIIYQAEPGSLKAPVDLRFFFSSKTIFWEVVKNATSYELQFSTNNIDFEVIYSGSDTEFAFTPPDGVNYIKCRARNMNGFGPFCDVVELPYFAVLPPPSNLQLELLPGGEIKFTWDLVPSATKYHVYRSIDNIGEYAGHWLSMGVHTVNQYICAPEPNKRNWFRVTAESIYQASTTSESVFIDIPANP